MKLTILGLLLAGIAFPQVNGAPSQVPAEDNPSLPRLWVIATGSKVTIQGNTTNETAYLETGNVYCVAAAVVTISFNGTAASTGSASLLAFGQATTQLPPTLWIDSNVGAGTSGMVFQVSAGQTLPLRLAPLTLRARSSTTNNITIASSTTCTFQYTFRTQYQ